MEPFPELDWDFASTLALSIGLGGLLGLERQQQDESDVGIMGVRTFALISLLGTLSALGRHFSPVLPYLIGAAVPLLLVVRYAVARKREHDLGITSEVAALLAFVLGAFVPEHPLLASAVAVVVFAILAIKELLERAVAKLSRDELLATVKFLLLTVVLLPLLPSEAVDPWGIYEPRSLWLLVILVSGIGYVGYFAIRILGRRRGIAVTGALGGLASSTAVTMAMSQRVAQEESDEGTQRAAVFSIIAANTIMIARTTLAVAAVHHALLAILWIPVAAMLTAGAVVSGAALIWLRRAPEAAPPDDDKGDHPHDVGASMNNPFQLKPALKFGVLFVIIIGAVHAAKEAFGDTGLLTAAFISGLADADAISITLARMTGSDAITPLKAAQGVTFALLANSLSKTFICALMGSLRLGLQVLLGLAVVLGAGALALTGLLLGWW